MAEKLQSKVKLRSGEVVTITHVKPSKPTPKTSKADEKPKTDDKPKTDEAPKADNKPKSDEKPKTDETKEPNEKPKETK